MYRTRTRANSISTIGISEIRKYKAGRKKLHPPKKNEIHPWIHHFIGTTSTPYIYQEISGSEIFRQKVAKRTHAKIHKFCGLLYVSLVYGKRTCHIQNHELHYRKRVEKTTYTLGAPRRKLREKPNKYAKVPLQQKSERTDGAILIEETPSCTSMVVSTKQGHRRP